MATDAPVKAQTGPEIDQALADTEPAIISESFETKSQCCPTTHQKCGLKTVGLLSLILHPDLEDMLTPGSILAANNEAIFQLLPLIMSAIHRISETSTNRDNFVRLVKVLRSRIVACRGLKLRFLLLVQNDGFAAHWDVRMVHRRNCYTASRRYLQELSNDIDAKNEYDMSVSLANELEIKASISEPQTSKITSNAGVDTKSLIAFATTSLLHPEHGIRRRVIVFRFRTFRSAFFGSDVVDGIMERSGFRSRSEAVTIGQRLVDTGILHKVASSSYRFRDDKRTVFQCNFSLQKDDDGHCKVVTQDGYELTSWEQVKQQKTKQIKQTSVQIPMDMIDLQSYEFWTNSVYVRGIDKGYRYGYRAITHPLYSVGQNPFLNLDFSAIEDKVIHDLKDDEDEDVEYADKESLPSSSTTMFTQDINDLNQEAAVIGSVVVRKVFSSIARPIIIQLRVPVENADLDDDDHHIVLPPGLLVKEGDNLMQDLGVETMFQCFNHIWAHSPKIKKKYGLIPESISYEVFPTSATQGFMEAVTGLTSLKDYDWKFWKEKYGADKSNVDEMIRTTVGSYIGAYVVGGRDRHFDNVLVKDFSQLLHIDFGFILGNNPPIDGPPISIAPEMEMVFRKLDVWDKFTDMFVDAFMALREYASAIIRTSIVIFSKAGFEPDQIRQFLQGKGSLNVHESDHKAAEFMRRQLLLSSGDIKTRFKQFAHEHIDPAWYGLLEKGFPPAVAIMKIVDAKDNRAAKKLAQSKKLASFVSEDERVNVLE